MGTAFRRATEGDIAAVVALVESAYRGDASREGWTTEAHLLDGQRTDAVGVTELLRRPDSRVLLAIDAGRLVGCCHIERAGTACSFGMFAVDPKLQRGGVGRALLEEGERVARDEWGCHEMTMTVIDSRAELVAWYERRGYRRTGVFQPFPYGDARYGLPKRDDLRFEVLHKRLA